MDILRDRILNTIKSQRPHLVKAIREFIRTPSLSGKEESIAHLLKSLMQTLGYHAIRVDRLGNVIGKIGKGKTNIVLATHMDTHALGERDAWRFDPLEGEFKAQKIFGHGALLAKGALTSMLWAGSMVQSMNLAPDTSLYVIGTVQGQDCEAMAYKVLFEVEKIEPHFLVLGLPTDLKIGIGQRGRLNCSIVLRGQVVPTALAETGFNPIYGMNRIVQNIEAYDKTLPQEHFLGPSSMLVRYIGSNTYSSNMLADRCSIHVERRFLPEDSLKSMVLQLKQLCQPTRANINVIEYNDISYKGLRLSVPQYLPAWEIPVDHPLVVAAHHTYKMLWRKPAENTASRLSSAAGYTWGQQKIPTILFGPGKESHIGPINDHVRLEDIEKAVAFYACLPGHLPVKRNKPYTRKNIKSTTLLPQKDEPET